MRAYKEERYEAAYCSAIWFSGKLLQTRCRGRRGKNNSGELRLIAVQRAGAGQVRACFKSVELIKEDGYVKRQDRRAGRNIHPATSETRDRLPHGMG